MNEYQGVYICDIDAYLKLSNFLTTCMTLLFGLMGSLTILTAAIRIVTE